MSTAHDDFQNLEQELLDMKTRFHEDEILHHWRTHEPKRIEALLLQGVLRKTLQKQAHSLRAVQKSLEEMELLPPALAKMEAWSRLMRIEEDKAEEAKAWGMTLEEYRNRP
jgi:hypothetical protein